MIRVETTERRIRVSGDFVTWRTLEPLGHVSNDGPRRYSLPKSPDMARRLRGLIEQFQLKAFMDDEFRGLVFKPAPGDELPHEETLRSRPYQRDGYWSLWHHDAYLLGDPMGCGKTKPVCDYIRNAKPRRTLVIAPKSVCPVWISELRKHEAGAYVVDVSSGTTQTRADRIEVALRASSGRLVVVINYDVVHRAPLGPLRQGNTIRRAGILDGTDWDVAVCDEAHAIKSPIGIISRIVARIGARACKRFALTGTPMPHSPMDVFGLYRFLDPRVFGRSFAMFRNEFAIMGGFENKEIVRFKNLEELSRRMFTIGRVLNKREVLPDLPAVTVEERVVTLSVGERRVHDEMENDLVSEIAEGQRMTADNGLVKLLRLQQATSGYASPDGADPIRIGESKRAVLKEILEGIDPTEPVVVFCRFSPDVADVHVAAESVGRKSCELSGLRNDVGAKWLPAHDGMVLASQIQSGAEGVDLTASNYVIFYSTGFLRGKIDQAIARVDRPGQTCPVTVIYMIAEDTVDRRIRVVIEKGGDIVRGVLDGYGRGRAG